MHNIIIGLLRADHIRFWLMHPSCRAGRSKLLVKPVRRLRA
jgi:hypothetical protein